jgi:hypothetical protein
MAVTTTDAVMLALGAQIIAQSSKLTADNTFYQNDPVNSPYAEDHLYINESNIDRKKLLVDLVKNQGVFHLVAWVVQETNPPVNLRSDLDSLVEEIKAAVKYDQTFGGLARVTEIVGILTDGGAYAEAGKAVARIVLNVLYYTTN